MNPPPGPRGDRDQCPHGTIEQYVADEEIACEIIENFDGKNKNQTNQEIKFLIKTLIFHHIFPVGLQELCNKQFHDDLSVSDSSQINN